METWIKQNGLDSGGLLIPIKCVRITQNNERNTQSDIAHAIMKPIIGFEMLCLRLMVPTAAVVVNQFEFSLRLTTSITMVMNIVKQLVVAWPCIVICGSADSHRGIKCCARIATW